MKVWGGWRVPKRGPLTLNAFLIVGSIFDAGVQYPFGGHAFPVAMGAMSLLCLLMNLGWGPTLAILGAYIGYILDPCVKSGPEDVSVWETVEFIMSGAALGFCAGLASELLLPMRHGTNKVTALTVLRQQNLTTEPDVLDQRNLTAELTESDVPRSSGDDKRE
jgi:hypothetical protein